jgi:spore coat protein A
MPITKYKDKLPVPRVLKPKYQDDEATYYEVRMVQAKQSLHSELPDTLVWCYEGTYPGPVIEARKNEKVLIQWKNELPDQHFLPVDKTLHGVMDAPEVRTVVHLHGASVKPESDGYPEAWFTKNFRAAGPYFRRRIYCYPNHQQAATLWYHDHALGITRLNVYAGLAGFYLIRDRVENTLALPKGDYEIPLLIQDRSLNPDGSLFYPSQPQPPVPAVNPSITPGVDGDMILVNGKIWPYLDVEPRLYRFRILNGSNHRFYRMNLEPGLPFYQIGTDGGFLEAPVRLEQLILAPAERADVIIDFSGCQGKSLVLKNDAPAPFPSGTPVEPETTGQIMQFRVILPLSGEDEGCIPESLYPVPPLPEFLAKVKRDMTMVVQPDQYGRLTFLLNGKMWHDPVTEKPQRGQVEIWNLINNGFVAHPIHVHLIQFQILNRQPFDVPHFNQTQELKFTGPPMPPDPNERGWKDTVRSAPGEVTRIVIRFEPYTGRYVWHCHLLEHEDYDMMRPLEVLGGCD